VKLNSSPWTPTIAWLFLLFVCVAVLLTDPQFLTKSDFAIGITLIIVVCCVIAAAVYSVFRSSLGLPVLLLVISLVPAFFFARAMWRLQNPAGDRFFQILFSGNYDSFHLLQDIVYIGLPFCWAVVSWKTLQARRTEM
jgi:ABC-type Fe3+ transport system permease subunit